jgi:peptidoglycan/LPS O-acetylase OafA/YrhL
VAASLLASRRPSPAPRPSRTQPAPQLGDGTLDWLDALKGIAILAVVTDHAFIISAYLVWKHLYFAVSWFIFLAGVSNTYSARRRNFDPRRDTFPFWRRRVTSLLPPYLGASAFAWVAVYAGRTPVAVFLREFAGFHSLPPLYFIPLLLQFLVAFPLLYLLLYRRGWGGRILALVLAVPVADLLANRITFGWPLGAHYLLGASFLFLFLLGMAVEPLLSSGRITPVPLLIGSLVVFALAEHGNIATGGMLMTHPPSNLLLAYASGLLGIAYALCRLLPNLALVRAAGWLGRRSLSIFVYHYPFVMPIFAYRHSAWMSQSPFHWPQALLMLVAIPVAIGGSLIVARGMALIAATLVRPIQRAENAICIGRLYTVPDRKGLRWQRRLRRSFRQS